MQNVCLLNAFKTPITPLVLTDIHKHVLELRDVHLSCIYLSACKHYSKLYIWKFCTLTILPNSLEDFLSFINLAKYCPFCLNLYPGFQVTLMKRGRQIGAFGTEKKENSRNM